MDSENENSNKIQILPWNLHLQAHLKPAQALSKVFSEFGKVVDVLHDSEIQKEETKKLDFSIYADYIKLHIPSLKDRIAKHDFLLKERRQIKEKIIDSTRRKDDCDRKHYESILSNIIEPQLKQWGDELEFQKNNPPKKRLEFFPIIETTSKSTKEITATRVVETTTKLSGGFSQIECNATKEEILNYFMILAKEKNHLNDEFFMTEKAVLEFVHKNFSVFNLTPSGKYFPINLLPKQKAILRYFMYRFYSKYDQVNNKKKYAKLLKHNFDIFKDDILKNLMSNMSESKKPIKGVIPISNYFQK